MEKNISIRPNRQNNIYDQNPSQLFGQQSIVMQRINEKLREEHETLLHFRIMNWNNHKFSYQPLSTDFLKSIFTDQIQSFQKSVSLIDDYNREIKNVRENHKEIKDGPWKNKFYGLLQNLLREVMYTKDDRILQKEFSDRVLDWAEEQLELNHDPKNASIFSLITKRNLAQASSAKKRVRTFTQDSTVADTSRSTFHQISQQTLPPVQNLLDSINNNQPNQQVQQQVQDYYNNHRTKHPDINTPHERLINYRKKLLQFEDPTQLLLKRKPQSMHQTMPVLQISLQEENKVTYPKPTGYLPQKEEEYVEPQEGDENQNQEQGNDDGGDIIDGMDMDDLVEQPIQEGRVGGKMVPDKIPFTNEEITKTKPIKQDFSKQFEQRSTFMHYIPDNDDVEKKMEQKWLENRQKEVQDKREAEELVKMVNEWSIAKNKISREINHKIDRQADGSRYNDCDYRPRVYTQQQINKIQNKIRNGTIDEEDVVPVQKAKSIFDTDTVYHKKAAQILHTQSQQGLKRPVEVDHSLFPVIVNNELEQEKQSLTTRLELNISKQNIKAAQNRYGRLLGLQKNLEEDRPQVIASMSVYSQQKRPQRQVRAFSSILDKYSNEYIRNEQQDEIEQIKNRMAKYKINIPIKKIADSIMIPELMSGEKLEKLPEPGMGLLENPHFEAAQKKKKKKK